jgi:hypothetical protein
MTAHYAGHDEVFEAGDAFYTPTGHVPVKNEPGTEFVWFCPSEWVRGMPHSSRYMQTLSTPDVDQ